MSDSWLQIHGLHLRRGSRQLCRDLELELCAGDMLAILGENGAGKSSLLLTLAGLLPATQGTISLGGQILGTLSRRRIARQLGMLLQDHVDMFPMTVWDAALLGRYAHLAVWQAPGPADRQVTRAALEQLDLLALAHRDVTTLSGGERRRLGLATLLVQDPRIYLLDEPTNHLDLRHQMQCLRLLSTLARERQRAVVFATHDLNLAVQFSNKVLMLYSDGQHRLGDSTALLTEHHLSSLFRHPIHGVPTAQGLVFYPGT